jgi:ubiquinone/menaquinone biosynthesis C-methylase UbiE
MIYKLVELFAGVVSGRNRAKKYGEFLNLIQPSANSTILDVGVNDMEYSAYDNYIEKHYAFPEKITAISHQPLKYFTARYPQVTTLRGDGLNLPFLDKSFDVALSNAVIEHVGDREQQIQFLREIARVALRGYITTPNRLLPVEVHTRIPLLHLVVSKNIFDKFLVMIGKSWAAGNYMRLLSRRELETILGAAQIVNYHITASRLLGIPLTYTVTWESGVAGRKTFGS